MKIYDKVTNDWDDWRINGQENYLKGVTLKWTKWKMPKPTWDHDHCSFCWKKFCYHETDPEAVQEGYATLDEYYWICKECFNDFKALFEWKIKSRG